MADAWSFLPASCPNQQVLGSERNLASKTKVESHRGQPTPTSDFQTLVYLCISRYTCAYKHAHTKTPKAEQLPFLFHMNSDFIVWNYRDLFKPYLTLLSVFFSSDVLILMRSLMRNTLIPGTL